MKTFKQFLESDDHLSGMLDNPEYDLVGLMTEVVNALKDWGKFKKITTGKPPPYSTAKNANAVYVKYAKHGEGERRVCVYETGKLDDLKLFMLIDRQGSGGHWFTVNGMHKVADNLLDDNIKQHVIDNIKEDSYGNDDEW